MKAVNIKSLTDVYMVGDDQLVDSFTRCHGIGEAQQGMRAAELEDICSLVNVLSRNGADVAEFDNFFVSYSIPQIGKEFDLLRFDQHSVVDIEIKHSSTEDKIRKQLKRNAYYLGFLAVETKCLYTYVCDTNSLYRWNGSDIERCKPSDLVATLRKQGFYLIDDVDSLFDPANYLVSPFNSTKAFVEKRYFLTKQQEEIKEKVLRTITGRADRNIAVTGRPGTGKTLLIYDIAAELMESGKRVIILHCANLNNGQYTLVNDYDWAIYSARYGLERRLEWYDVVIVDEAQRMYPAQLNDLTEKLAQSDTICVFSYDENQCLSNQEIDWKLSDRIKRRSGDNHYKLTAKIRTNREVAEFIGHLLDNRYRGSVTRFPHISVSYSNNAMGVVDTLEMFKKRGWIVPVYTPSKYTKFHYEDYYISSLSAHDVIGQEFDNIVAVIDSRFVYDENGKLSTRKGGSELYSQLKMFYQIVTRTRKRLHVVVLKNPGILQHILSVVGGD